MEIQNRDKTKNIRIAAMTSAAGNAVLAALKISAGLLSMSEALVADGFDSSADVLISIITLVIVKIIAKPADAEHPWGHGRAETVATVLLSFIIFFMGAQLSVNAVSTLISGNQRDAPSAYGIVITVISIVGKILLAKSQSIFGKRAGSAMIEANAKNMMSDVLVSFGVLAGLAISAITGTAHADSVIAVLIGLWIIKTAVEIFLEANLELMDGSSGKESYHVIVSAVNKVEGAFNPHRARMRRIAGFWDIDLDIEVDPGLTVSEAHGIATKVEGEIKRRLENVFDIMVHVEPHGDDAEETFGLSQEDMSE